MNCEKWIVNSNEATRCGQPAIAEVNIENTKFEWMCCTEHLVQLVQRRGERFVVHGVPMFGLQINFLAEYMVTK